MMVMMMDNTPSLNAANLPFVMLRIKIFCDGKLFKIRIQISLYGNVWHLIDPKNNYDF